MKESLSDGKGLDSDAAAETAAVIVDKENNEFTPLSPDIKGNNMVAAEALKEVAQVQAAVMMAKKYPRDRFTGFKNIMDDCERYNLAKAAVYSFPRGETTVTGPSIRLAEVCVRNWGNMDCGIRELSRDAEKSVCEAYAWDLETNSRSTRIFEVPHIRATRKGSYRLTDPRDIYENVANQGARRLRACILQAIPGDVVDKAVAKCKETVTKKSGKPLVDRIQDMIVSFSRLGVSKAHIEKRLQHPVDTLTEEEMFDFLTIYNTIGDNHAKRSDFFDIAETEPTERTGVLEEKIRKVKEKNTPSDPPQTGDAAQQRIPLPPL
jgi:hypothetical protein